MSSFGELNLMRNKFPPFALFLPHFARTAAEKSKIGTREILVS
jgi:hypothetical protein